jgi:hypothetical protein
VRGAPPLSYALAGAIVGVLLTMAVSGARVVRQPIAHAGAGGKSGVFEQRCIRKIVEPGGGLTRVGPRSRRPHKYSASRVAGTYRIRATAPAGSRTAEDVPSA